LILWWTLWSCNKIKKGPPGIKMSCSRRARLNTNYSYRCPLYSFILHIHQSYKCRICCASVTGETNCRLYNIIFRWLASLTISADITGHCRFGSVCKNPAAPTSRSYLAHIWDSKYSRFLYPYNIVYCIILRVSLYHRLL